MSNKRKFLLTDLFIAEIFSEIMHHGAQFREGYEPWIFLLSEGSRTHLIHLIIPITVLIKELKHLSDLSCSLNPLK